MTPLLFTQLAANKVAGGPHAVGIGHCLKGGLERCVPLQISGLHHRCYDRQVFPRQRFAFLKRSHAVPNLQAGIPQTRYESF